MSLMESYGGELAALAAALLWAAASVVYRRVGEWIPPLGLNLLKGVLALAMLVPVLLATGDSGAQVGSVALILLSLSGAIGIGLGDTAYFASLNLLGARRALLLGILAPPLAALISWVALGETLTPGAWGGILVTVLGVAWVVTERVSGAPEASTHLGRGLGFGLLAALAQASGAVLSRAAFVHTAVSPQWGAFLRLAGGTVVLALWIALARKPLGLWLRTGQSNKVWARLLVAVFAGTFLAIWLQQVSLSQTSAGIMQTLFSTSPLFVLPISVWMGEAVSPRAVAGAAVGLVGIGLLFGLA